MSAGLLRADAVVVGGGLAGLWAVLHLPAAWEVVVVDPMDPGDPAAPGGGSSPWAQGGMAVAVGSDDSPDLHASDTLRAGAGLCDRRAVEVLVAEAPRAFDELVGMGARFDTDVGGAFDLNREGGQSVPRSVHAADATGREIMRAVAARSSDRARRLSGTAGELIVDGGECLGVRVATSHGDVDLTARAVLLATGGCGALWPSTTNPASATGDGVALGFEAGAEVRDLEFMQFHPTALAAGGLRRVLLTEALRGEGAIVTDENGERFLFDVHPDGELAPRDVVARAIAEQSVAYLDARPIGADRVRTRFPNITRAALDAGFDLTSERVPVEPAAHYFLGGVATDIDGRTSVARLFAAGECAATGVHGANRMAGNSLAEAVVFGRRAALSMGGEPEAPARAVNAADEEATGVRPVDPHAWERLRDAMSTGAGLVRSGEGLARASEEIAAVAATGPQSIGRAVIVASLICRAAAERTESRGVHFRSDYAEPRPEWDERHVSYVNS